MTSKEDFATEVVDNAEKIFYYITKEKLDDGSVTASCNFHGDGKDIPKDIIILARTVVTTISNILNNLREKELKRKRELLTALFEIAINKVLKDEEEK